MVRGLKLFVCFIALGQVYAQSDYKVTNNETKNTKKHFAAPMVKEQYQLLKTGAINAVH